MPPRKKPKTGTQPDTKPEPDAAPAADAAVDAEAAAAASAEAAAAAATSMQRQQQPHDQAVLQPEQQQQQQQQQQPEPQQQQQQQQAGKKQEQEQPAPRDGPAPGDSSDAEDDAGRALDAAARSAVKAIRCGRLPADRDRPSTAALLVRALGAAGTPDEAAAAAAALKQLVGRADGHPSAARLIAIEAGVMPAIARAAADRASVVAALKLLVSLCRDAGGPDVLALAAAACAPGMLPALAGALRIERDEEAAAARALASGISNGGEDEVSMRVCMAASLVGAMAEVHELKHRVTTSNALLAALVGAARSQAVFAGLYVAQWAAHVLAAACEGNYEAFVGQPYVDGALALCSELVGDVSGGADRKTQWSALMVLRAIARSDMPRVVGSEAAVKAIVAAAVDPEHNYAQKARTALRIAAARGGAAAATAAALAPHLISSDTARRAAAQSVLRGPPWQLPAAAVDAMALMATAAEQREKELLREVEELRAVPVNTRAAIVELAAAVRGGGSGGR